MSIQSHPPLRVLIVDDSVFNRRSITEILSTSPDVEVVGKAADGEEALRLVSMLRPDVITLDLEMPRMDGFTLLRILMTKMPTPVIVVSSYSQKENVFKALELGALDFVAKPDRYADPDLAAIRDARDTSSADHDRAAPSRRDWVVDGWSERADGDLLPSARKFEVRGGDRAAHSAWPKRKTWIRWAKAWATSAPVANAWNWRCRPRARCACACARPTSAIATCP